MKATAVSPPETARYEGLSAQDLLRAYRTMVLSRKLDDKEIQLKNQSLIFFQISGAGHEAVLDRRRHGAASRPRLVPSLLPRSRALPDARHDAARDAPRRRSAPRTIRTPAAARCRRTGATSGSTSSRSRARPARSACTRSAPPKRAGSTRRSPRSKGASRAPRSDEVTYVSIGEGTTSEGEFWESLNSACTLKLPVVYLIEDNGYAISVPVEVQTPGGDISKLVASFPGLFVQSIDGTDFLGSYKAMTRGRGLRARAQGPGVRPREGDPPVLALAVGRREAVQDGGRARRGSQARSDYAARDVPRRRRRSRAKPS